LASFEDVGPRTQDGEFIGHYGCAGRLVKVRGYQATLRLGTGFRMPKAKWKRQCPACGFEHIFSIHWRKPLNKAELRKAEINLKGK
jgi:hypothetical protein